MDETIIWVTGILVFGLGLALGVLTEGSSWRTDCEMLGAHLHDKTAYVCSKK